MLLYWNFKEYDYLCNIWRIFTLSLLKFKSNTSWINIRECIEIANSTLYVSSSEITKINENIINIMLNMFATYN